MSNLAQIAQEYQINTQKPFFPVNSLRLFYIMISDHYTQKNPAAREKITSLIPLIEAVFDARSQHRSTAPAPTVASDYEAAHTQITQVLSKVETPAVRTILTHLFTYIYPLQDEIFLNLYQKLLSDHAAAPQDLQLLTHARAMDSIVFSTLLGEVIQEFAPLSDPSEQEKLQLSLHHHINLVYQINDVVDAVVFAKDDLEANSFSPFRLIQKITPDPTGAKELIKNTLAALKQKAELFPFPDLLQSQMQTFYTELIEVVHPSTE